MQLKNKESKNKIGGNENETAYSSYGRNETGCIP